MQQCPFDLYKCIRNLMGLMSNYTTGRHQKVTLSTLIDPTVPSFVIGDKQHLRQVLINLLRFVPHTRDEGLLNQAHHIHSTAFPPTYLHRCSNALKFTPEGSITLRVFTNSTWETSDKEKVRARSTLCRSDDASRSDSVARVCGRLCSTPSSTSR